MASKKQKEYWYVLVITSYGAVFVTKINHGDRTAEWDKLEKPLGMSEEWAKDLAMGLTLNGHLAYSICQKWELDNQPYRYTHGEFVWKANKDDNE